MESKGKELITIGAHYHQLLLAKVKVRRENNNKLCKK